MRLHEKQYRYLCSELVTIEVLDSLGRTRILNGNLEEISSSILCVLSDFKIPRRSRVVVQCQGHRLSGRIENVTVDEHLGWYSDVVLEPESRWSEELFLPGHLLPIPVRLAAAGSAA